MFNHFSVIVFLALFSFSYSQLDSPGQCNDRDRRDVKAVQFFQTQKFAANGAPYYPVLANTKIFDCRVIRYTSTGPKSMNAVYEQKNVTSGVKVKRQGKITLADSAYLQGILEMDYPQEPKLLVFKVIGIKYDEFAVLYRCSNIDKSNRREFLHVISRNRSLSSAQLSKVNEMLEVNGLDNKLPLSKVQQDPQVCA